MSQPLTPSEVRKHILTQHGALRQRLGEVEAALHRPAAEAPPGELAALVNALSTELLQHIAEEERILRPLLADIDAWGSVRVQMMDEEHGRQRARIARLQGQLAAPPPGWAGEVREFITELREEMVGEEKDALHANLLRDDTVTIDYFGG